MIHLYAEFTISRNENYTTCSRNGNTGQNMKIADLDLIFVAVNVETGQSKMRPNALAIIAQADGVDEFEVANAVEEDELEELTYENETLLRDLYCHYCTQNEDERLRKRLQMNALLMFDQAELLDLELTKLEAKQSFIDCQDDTENSVSGYAILKNLWKAVFDAPMRNGRTANLQNIQFVKNNTAAGIVDSLEAVEERF